MATIPTNIKLYVSQYQHHPVAVLVGLVAVFLSLLLIPGPLIELFRYFSFTRGHDKFHREAADRFRGQVVSFFRTPWSPRTYYLSDVESIKRMFSSNSALHAHALADILHEMVWEVPRNPDMTSVDKMVHQAMTKGKLTNVIAAYEDHLMQDLKRYVELVGKEGKLMPLQHMGFRMNYNNTIPAVLGPRFPLDETRIPNQILAECMQAFTLTSMLPVLPRGIWNRLLPGTRRGMKARDQVKDAIIDWEKNDGVAYSSDIYQNISKSLDATGANPEDRARWINMVQFGFSGNTGESLGWILCYLLQSPKLLQQVLLEVNSLPEGPLASLPLRQLCPHLDSVIHETWRFVGSVFSGRMALKNAKIPGVDKVFPKGSIIRAMTRTATFDTQVWGPDAGIFRGDRFVGNEGLMKHLQVFGGGISACPGRHLATHELQLMSAHVLRTFAFGSVKFHEKDGPTDAVDKIRRAVDGVPDILIDKDGASIPIRFSGFDVDSGVEAISGLLVPKYEPVAHMKPSGL